MYINAIEELDRVLGEIEAKIQYIESSPNCVFALIEGDIISLFHVYNLCFKRYWVDFNHHSATQLLHYQKIVKTHADLTKKYESLFGEQIQFLAKVLDFDEKSVKDLAPFIFVEQGGRSVIDFYNDCLKHKKDKEDRPLYKIDVDRNSRIMFIDDSGNPITPFVFRSDLLNYGHYQSLLRMHNCLGDMFELMQVICSYSGALIDGFYPSKEDIILALETELRHYAKEDERGVRRELTKIFWELKRSNSHSPASDIWAQVLELESDAFRLAIAGKLVENQERLFDHYDEDKRKLWTDNFPLLQKIKDTCIDNELFDLRLAVNTYNLLSVLTADNLNLFYELVLRRNIIHSEMFPELKSQYEEWLNRDEKSAEDDSSAEKQKRQNLFALKKNLKELLRENWFNEARSNVKYDATWTDGFVDALIASEYGEEIANIWYDDGRHGKCNYVRGYIIGLLKDNGVLSGKYGELATKVKIDRKYLGEGKKQPYADWVKAYVAGQF